MTPIVAFSGPSGAGKTWLLVRLLAALRRRGVRVAALKHSGHRHAFDRRGADSDRLRRAGARAVVVAGPGGVAYFGPPVTGARALARLLPEVDLVLAEGFKSERLPRIEVHRRSIDRSFLCAHDRGVVAVVSDERPPRRLPLFARGDVEGLADFLCGRFLGQHRGWGTAALAGGKMDAHPCADVPAVRPNQERDTMPRTTKKTSAASSRSTRKTGTRAARASPTVREAGRKGGKRTLKARGAEFYSQIGRKGGKSTGPGGAKKPSRSASMEKGGEV